MVGIAWSLPYASVTIDFILFPAFPTMMEWNLPEAICQTLFPYLVSYEYFCHSNAKGINMPTKMELCFYESGLVELLYVRTQWKTLAV